MLQFGFERGDERQPVDKPRRVAGCRADLVRRGAVAQHLHRGHQPAVIGLMQQVRTAAQLRGIGKSLLKCPQRLAQRGFKRALDRHHLAGRLHLRAKRPVRGRELIEGPARNLDDAVVESRLEGRARLAGDRIRDFVQPAPRRDLGGHARDRISRRLRRERRRAAHPRIHLDDVVLIGGGVQRELDVAPTLDAELPDDAQRRGSEHLVLTVGERLARRHHDAVTGVHAHRIEVLHIAYGDAGVVGVPHDLVLDLFPAGQRALH